MKLENLNLVELNATEVRNFEGGRFSPAGWGLVGFLAGEVYDCFKAFMNGANDGIREYCADKKC